MADTNQGNVKVVARFRPLNDKEKQNSELQLCINFIDERRVSMKRNQGDDSNNQIQNEFKFDKVLRMDATQSEVYESTAKPIIKSVLQGFNCTVFTYGQTSSGKTFTMLGSENQNYDLRGIIPRSLETLFEAIDESGPSIEYQMTVSMVEIYMEKIKDLLDITKNKLKIRESKAKGIYIENVTEQIVIEEAEIFHILRIGEGNRSKFATKMNEFSSRSHTIFMLQINQKEKITHSCKVGKLFLIDLAGSEKVQKTQAEGKTLEEAKQINKSLSALGNVINALTDQKQGTHIPYRDSKLTRMLQESLGGNARTVLIVTCSPSLYNEAETYSTLRFGFRALSVKNSPVINRQYTIEELQMRQLKLEKLVKLKVLIIKKLEEVVLKNSLKLPDYNLNENLKELEIDENNYAVTPVTSPKNQELEVINSMSNRSNILVKANSVDLDSNKDEEEEEEDEGEQFQQQQDEEIIEPKLSKKKSGFFRSARNPLEIKAANEISLFGKNNAEEKRQDSSINQENITNNVCQQINLNVYNKKDQVLSNLKIFDNLVVKKHDHSDKEWLQKNQHLIEEIFKFNFEENTVNNPTLDSVEANNDQIEQNQQLIKQQFIELDEQQKMLTIGAKGMTQTFYTMRKLENQLEQQQQHISEQSKRIDIFRREFNWVSEKAHNLEQEKIQLNQQIQLKDQMQTLLKNQQDDEKKHRDQLLDEVSCLKQQIGWLKKSKANLFHLIFKKLIDRTQAQQPSFQLKDSQHEQEKLEFIESSGQQIFNLMMADLQKDTIIQKILELCSKENKNLLVKFQDIITKVLELNDDKTIENVEIIEEKIIEEEQKKDEIQQLIKNEAEKIFNNIEEANTPSKIKKIQLQQQLEKDECNQQKDVIITTEFLTDNYKEGKNFSSPKQKTSSSFNKNQSFQKENELDSSLNNITNSIKKFQKLSIQTFQKYKNQYCKDIQSPDVIFKKIYETGIKQMNDTLGEFQYPIFIKNPYQIQKVQKPYRIYNVRKVITKDIPQESQLYQPKERYKFQFSISGKIHQINLTTVDIDFVVKEKLRKTVRLAKIQYARNAWPYRVLDSHKSFLFSQFQLEQQVIFQDLLQNLVFYEQMLRQLNLIFKSHLLEISNKCTQIETLSIRSIQHKIFSNMKQHETQMVFPWLVEFMREFKTQLRRILNAEFHTIKQIAIDKRIQYNKIKYLRKEQKRKEMLKKQQLQQQQQQQQLLLEQEKIHNHPHHIQEQNQQQQQQTSAGIGEKRKIKMSIETKNLENLTTQPDSHYDNQSSSADSFDLDPRLMVDKNSAEHLHFSPKSPPLQSAAIFKQQEQLINQLKLTIEYMKLEIQELKEQQIEQQLRASYQQDYSKIMENLDTYSTFDLIHHSPTLKKTVSKKQKANGETNANNTTSVQNKKASPKSKKKVVKKQQSSIIHSTPVQDAPHISNFQAQQQMLLLQQQLSQQPGGSNKKPAKKHKVKRYTVEKDDKNCDIF